MKAAICSSDGIQVNLHFGMTNVFYIYRIEHGERELLEKREVDNYSPSESFLKETEKNHPFDAGKFELIWRTISDCDRVYTVDIGELPEKKLAEKGIKVQRCACPVDQIPTCKGNCKTKSE